MLSMPPASITWLVPALSWSWANMMALRPLPHILLMVVQAVDSASPAPNAAWRAGAWPWPAISTLPMMTSSISSALRPARSTVALIATLPSWLADREENTPSMPPMGVRATEAMTMGSWDMAIPTGWGNSGGGLSLKPFSYSKAAHLRESEHRA